MKGKGGDTQELGRLQKPHLSCRTGGTLSHPQGLRAAAQTEVAQTAQLTPQVGQWCCWWAARQLLGLPATSAQWGSPHHLVRCCLDCRDILSQLTSQRSCPAGPMFGPLLLCLSVCFVWGAGQRSLGGLWLSCKYFKCWAKCHVFVVSIEQSPGKHNRELSLTAFLSVGAKRQRGRLNWQAIEHVSKASNLSCCIKSQTQVGTNGQKTNSCKHRAMLSG